MLEAIENLFEPTSYTAKPGCHVDFLTPEVCRHIQMIFMELGLDKDVSGEYAGTGISGQTTEPHSESPGGGQRKRARING